MGNFQNGAPETYPQSHAYKEWKEEQEPVPIYHHLMEQTAQEITQSIKLVMKDNVQVL